MRENLLRLREDDEEIVKWTSWLKTIFNLIQETSILTNASDIDLECDFLFCFVEGWLNKDSKQMSDM